MKREIEFRGKTAKGKWVYGYYCPCVISGFPATSCIVSKERLDNGCWTPEEVIPETVGQYVGIKDKKGNKIFEGDIVDCWSEGKNARGTVQQRKDGLWIIYPSWQKNIMWGLCPDINGGTTVEVIGNIFDKESDNGD